MLDVIVVGSGPGGLASAIALRRVGHRVTVIERLGEYKDVGAGVQMAPNATRVFKKLGVLEKVRSAGVEPQYRIMRRWNDGSVIHRKPLGPAIETDYGTPFLVIHRADLTRALVECATDRAGPGEPVRFEMGFTVADYQTEGDKAVVRTSDGKEWRADVVIGADGVHSVARRCIGEPDSSTYSGEACWLGNIRLDRIPRELREFAGLDTPGTSVWLGPERHVVHYPVRGGKLLTFGATTPFDETEESYLAEGNVADMLDQLQGWDPRLLEILGSVDMTYLTPLRVRQPLSRWSAGRVGLIGDACHPMLPYQAQGAAQAIEDAAVLGDVLADAKAADVEQALQQYETSRRARATAIQAASSMNSQHYHVVDPDEQARRDARIVLQGGNASLEWEWLWRGTPTEQPPAGR